MKKLGKLTINPEKVIKNEELVNLRGGYNMYLCWCYCDDPDEEGTQYSLCGSAIAGGTPGSTGCMNDCDAVYGVTNVTGFYWTDKNPYGY